MDDSESGLLDASKEWKEKADKVLKFSETEITRGRDRQSSKSRQTAARTAEFTSAKLATSVAKLAQEVEENQKHRQEWAKTQIDDITDQTKLEIQSLEALREEQQRIFQAQLTEKNDVWEKAVLERREEAAQLRSMISHLSSAVSVARNEMKTDIDEAKRRAQESANVIRGTREKQIQQIAGLTGDVQKEQSNFEMEAK
jgi:hypothetical protein